jgi:hypothetical protein
LRVDAVLPALVWIPLKECKVRIAILSLITTAVLALAAGPAGARPPQYFSNNAGTYQYGYVPYQYGYYPTYSAYAYPASSSPGYSYSIYSDPSWRYAPGSYPFGPSGRAGALHPAPMSWSYGGYRTWDGRP